MILSLFLRFHLYNVMVENYNSRKVEIYFIVALIRMYGMCIEYSLCAFDIPHIIQPDIPDLIYLLG